MNDLRKETRILLYRGWSFVDTLIRWQTWGRVAHAALYFPQFGDVIYESVLHGVTRRAWTNDDAKAEQYIVTQSPWGAPNWSRAVEFLDKQVGKPYDIKGLFQFLARSGDDNPRAWFCSDLVFEAVRHAGVLLVARVPRCKVSPEQIRRSPLLLPYPHDTQFDYNF
jgi:uncharacterized protein YycO